MKQYNEQDVLKAIAGSYQPGFLQIKLTNSFDGGLGGFSQNELGTFLHEYVHFLQNISTPWGLYMSMVQYQTLAKTFAFIQESSQEIELPLQIREAELDRKWSIIKLGSGYYPFSRADELLRNHSSMRLSLQIPRLVSGCKRRINSDDLGCMNKRHIGIIRMEKFHSRTRFMSIG